MRPWMNVTVVLLLFSVIVVIAVTTPVQVQQMQQARSVEAFDTPPLPTWCWQTRRAFAWTANLAS